MNDVVAGIARLAVRLLLVAAGVMFFVSLVAAMLVFALVWGLRNLWARLTGRPAAPWVMRMDPRAGWSTVYRSQERWSGFRTPPSQDQADATPPAHRRPLSGTQDVTDVEVKPPQTNGSA